ncbi:hypothetical protein FG93_03597 [Bosea sp. LC85]|jgi:hypothetical protein|nr:hypothetical protein FG93_03597 [Bosea sp. LC85]
MVLARKLVVGMVELASLGLFLGMIWLWAALLAAPSV